MVPPRRPPRTYNKAKNDCLKRVHKATRVKNLIKLCKRLRPPNSDHQQWSNCTRDKARGCKDPHSCTSTAEAILLNLRQKYNPTGPTNKDDLTLTHRCMEKNARANIARGDEITFNLSVTTRLKPIRLLQNLRKPTPRPLPCAPPSTIQPTPPPPPLTLYTDSSCLHNGQQNATCGAGIWAADDHPLNRAIRVPGDTQSNQIGELAAVVVALQIAPLSADLTIIMDSRYVIQTLTVSLPTSEDRGWVKTPNATWLKAAAYHLRRRSAPTHFKWTKGHNGTTGNEEADKLAAIGAQKPILDEIDLSVPRTFNRSGIKVSAVTQASVYAHLASGVTTPLSRPTQITLDRIRASLEELNKKQETDTHIWTRCRHPDIRRPIQTFLFKAIHNALRIGDFWSNIPHLSDRAHCAGCNTTPESLEHILLDCESPTVQQIWRLAQRTWPPTLGNWPDLSLGLILGCGSIALPQPEETHIRQNGPSRLLRILISESAHLIWVMRCERTIQDRAHSPEEVQKRWQNKINYRITLDRQITTTMNHKPITKKIVADTWEQSLLLHSTTLDPEWINHLEVLVGITLARPPTERNRQQAHGAPHTAPCGQCVRAFFLGPAVPKGRSI